MTPIQPFHLAFPVQNLEEARSFYSGVLGCTTGRESNEWIDFNFYGHQIVAHLAPSPDTTCVNRVDGQDVPVRHFGVILEWGDWENLARKLQNAPCRFLVKPCVRFQGKTGEQATMFLTDPSGNAIEFKAFRHPEELFARDRTEGSSRFST